MDIMDETKPKKQSKASTAKKIRDLTTYAGEVALFELSKQLKKGVLGTNFIIVAIIKPRNGLKNILVWLADEEGNIPNTETIKEFTAVDMKDALKQLGYQLV